MIPTFLLCITLSSLSADLNANGDSATEADECPPIKVVESPYLHQQWQGSTNPEKIPEYLKIRSFEVHFKHLGGQIVEQLSSNDHALLTNAMSESDYWRTLESNRYSQEFVELCSRIDAYDIEKIAMEYDQLATASNERAAEGILVVIDSLSPAGRKSVLQYIANKVTPKLSFPMVNSVTQAKDDPERFRDSLEVECYVSIHGEFPPEVKRELECAAQQPNPTPERSGGNYTSLQSPPRN